MQNAIGCDQPTCAASGGVCVNNACACDTRAERWCEAADAWEAPYGNDPLYAVHRLNDGYHVDTKRRAVFIHGMGPRDRKGRWRENLDPGGSDCVYDCPPANFPKTVMFNYKWDRPIEAPASELASVLDRECSRTDADATDGCYLICHSQGCLVMGYALAMFGGGAGAERRWDIFWTANAASLENGIAEVEYAFDGMALADDDSCPYEETAPQLCETLNKTTLNYDYGYDIANAPWIYDHNETMGLTMHMFAAAHGTMVLKDESGVPVACGYTDYLASLSSALGVDESGGRKAVTNDEFCSDLPLVARVDPALDETCPAGASDSPVLYAHREVQFADCEREFTHTQDAANTILGPTLQWVFANATP